MSTDLNNMSVLCIFNLETNFNSHRVQFNDNDSVAPEITWYGNIYVYQMGPTGFVIPMYRIRVDKEFLPWGNFRKLLVQNSTF